MKKLLVFMAPILIFVASCEKQYVEPEIPAPTVSFKKSSAYSDQTVLTPESSVLLFEGILTMENGPIGIIPTVTLTSADSLTVKYTALKNMYITITGVEGVSSKKNPAQSGSTFDITGLYQNGKHTLRVYATAPLKFTNSIITAVELSYEWQDPQTGELHIGSVGTVKGQTITFK